MPRLSSTLPPGASRAHARAASDAFGLSGDGESDTDPVKSPSGDDYDAARQPSLRGKMRPSTHHDVTDRVVATEMLIFQHIPAFVYLVRCRAEHAGGYRVYLSHTAADDGG